jgi:hypothetical protein
MSLSKSKCLYSYNCLRIDIYVFTFFKACCSINQWILKGNYHCTVWLVWNQLCDNWQFLFLFAKQTNPNQSNRRSMVQWYLVLPALTIILTNSLCYLKNVALTKWISSVKRNYSNVLCTIQFHWFYFFFSSNAQILSKTKYSEQIRDNIHKFY